MEGRYAGRRDRGRADREYLGRVDGRAYRDRTDDRAYQDRADDREYRGRADDREYRGRADGRAYRGRADDREYLGRVEADRADTDRAEADRAAETDRAEAGAAEAVAADRATADATGADTTDADTADRDTTATDTTDRGTTSTGATTTGTGTGTTEASTAGSVVLKPGDRGEAVKQLQRRLHAGHYYFGRIHGVYDEQTKFAVYALQKSRKMLPKGQVGSEVWKALNKSSWRWRPLVPEGAANRVEINLNNQLLTVYRNRRPVLFSHISSGAEVRYCEGGRCGMAITPVGDFRVQSRAPGWTTGRLGSMYNSLYFTGAIAMHGSTKVPLHPASHGCVRLPLETSKRLFQIVKVGEPVYVRGSIR